jgi:polyisoprenoid-binding protein YceI
MTESSVSAIPGFDMGRWEIDPNHSEISFVIRHLGISKVRCRFDRFSGTIVTDEDLAQSSATATIDVSSIDTNAAIRDDLVRSAEILDAANFPEITFTSSAVRAGRTGFLVDGDLTIRGTTRPVTLDMQANGFAPDNFGGFRAGFSARVEINRTDFGITFNKPIPGTGSLLLGNTLAITLEIEAIRQTDDLS